MVIDSHLTWNGLLHYLVKLDFLFKSASDLDTSLKDTKKILCMHLYDVLCYFINPTDCTAQFQISTQSVLITYYFWPWKPKPCSHL